HRATIRAGSRRVMHPTASDTKERLSEHLQLPSFIALGLLQANKSMGQEFLPRICFIPLPKVGNGSAGARSHLGETLLHSAASKRWPGIRGRSCALVTKPIKREQHGVVANRLVGGTSR